MKATLIRDVIHKKINILDILPLQNWTRDLNIVIIDWKEVFKSLYSFSKNFKLVQFQYKFLMRISTCRYMRYKMKIDTDSPECIYCEGKVETLVHIFLECPKSISLLENLQEYIVNNMISNYSDANRLYYITCCHENPALNYIWVALKYYISRCFQNFKEPSLRGFKNSIKLLLNGENEATTNSIMQCLQLVD